MPILLLSYLRRVSYFKYMFATVINLARNFSFLLLCLIDNNNKINLLTLPVVLAIKVLV